jgi:predicted Rossmann fold flavoprotein
MSDYAVAVIGGGAAGLCAAISAARRGHSVVLCEKNPQLGKKILATGNGRCNLLNEDLREIFYNAPAQKTVKAVLGVAGKAELMDFFKGLGLRLYSSEGRIFPVTNQAASVLKVLEMELKRLSVQVELSFECTGIGVSKNRFSVLSRGRQTLTCGKLILSGGGKSYPALGSNGSLWEIAHELGHSIVEPVPSAVPLVVKDGL